MGENFARVFAHVDCGSMNWTISHSEAGRDYLPLKKSAAVRVHARLRRTELNSSKSEPPGTDASRGTYAQRHTHMQSRTRHEIAGRRWQLPRKLQQRAAAPYSLRRRMADAHRIMRTP